MKLRKYKKRNIGTYITLSFIVIIVSLIFTFLIINYFSRRVNEILLPMAESKVRKVVTMIINSACDESLIKDNLYSISKNENNEIEMVNYNSFEITKLINEVTLNVEESLKEFENNQMNYYGDVDDLEGGVVAEIPFGVIFGNSLLSNIGPMIKIRLNMLGDITSNIETEVKPYGINNAYVEMRISLQVTARVVLPFVSEKVVISNVIPISMNIVQGTVPEGYIYSYK